MENCHMKKQYISPITSAVRISIEGQLLSASITTSGDNITVGISDAEDFESGATINARQSSIWDEDEEY